MGGESEGRGVNFIKDFLKGPETAVGDFSMDRSGIYAGGFFHFWARFWIPFPFPNLEKKDTDRIMF